ncbi:ucp2 [Symbiodinium sp. KB8]|nr:ucp2 [Symbiodinium sp. KB8]
MDTLKLRMQIHTGQASGVFQVARGLIASHGVSALWSGLVPGCQRQILFGGIRMGAYDIIKANVSSALGEREGSSSLAVKLLSGVLSGSLAAAVASPTDLVKVRMQAQSGVAATPGHTPYANWLDCYRRVLREEGGVRALWRGCGPNIARNACVNMVELATYDSAKEAYSSSFGMAGLPLHVASALTTGLAATLFGSPIDVLKSRWMAQRARPGGPGLLHLVRDTAAKEGLRAFYRGFGANFSRMAGWNIIFFVTYEQVKGLLL